MLAILCSKFQIRIWAEYVESDANVSDGLSRDAEQDNTHKELGCELLPFALPDFPDLWNAPIDALLSFFDAH